MSAQKKNLTKAFIASAIAVATAVGDSMLKITGFGPLPEERAKSFLAGISEPEYLEKSIDLLIRGRSRMDLIKNSAEDYSVGRLEQDVHAAREKIINRSLEDQVAWAFRTGVKEHQLQMLLDRLDQARAVLANIEITDEIRNILDQQIHDVEHDAYEKLVKIAPKGVIDIEKWRITPDLSASEINREGPEIQVVLLIMAGRSENDLREMLKIRDDTPVSDI